MTDSPIPGPFEAPFAPQVLWSYAGPYSVSDDGSGFGTFDVGIPSLADVTMTASAPTLLVRFASGTAGSGTFSSGGIANTGDDTYSMSFVSNDQTVNLDIPFWRLNLTDGIPDVNLLIYYLFTTGSSWGTSHRGFLLGGTLSFRVRLNWSGSIAVEGATIFQSSFQQPHVFPDNDAGSIVMVLVDTAVTPGYDVVERGPPYTKSTITYAPAIDTFFPPENRVLLSTMGVFEAYMATSGISMPSFYLTDGSGGGGLRTFAENFNGSNTSVLLEYYGPGGRDPGVSLHNALVSGTFGRVQFLEVQQYYRGDLLVSDKSGQFTVPLGLNGGKAPSKSGQLEVPLGFYAGKPARRKGRSYGQIIGG